MQVDHAAADPVKVIYVTGAGRSGSTLLEMLLRERLDVVAVGEIRQIWAAGMRRNARCECGEPFDRCPFWSSTVDAVGVGPTGGRELERIGRSFARTHRLPRLLWPTRSRSDDERYFFETTRQVYDSIVSASGGRPVLDTSKAPWYGLALAAEPTIDLHVIHLVRDSRAVAYSWQRKKEWRAATQRRARRGFMKVRGPVDVSRRWMKQNLLGALLRFRASSFQLVRYEDLAGDPVGVVAEILPSLPGTRIEPSATAERVHHGFMGNPVRFESNRPDVRLDDEWRQQLSPRDATLVTALTWPGLVSLGYRLRRGSMAAPTS